MANLVVLARVVLLFGIVGVWARKTYLDLWWKTPFGANTMMESGWAKELTASRWSRAVYGVLKMVAFCGLGIVLGLERMGPNAGLLPIVRPVTDVLVYATAIFCIVRAVPVIWDGRRYFAEEGLKRGG